MFRFNTRLLIRVHSNFENTEIDPFTKGAKYWGLGNAEVFKNTLSKEQTTTGRG